MRVLILFVLLVSGCARPAPRAPEVVRFRAKIVTVDRGHYCMHFEPGGGYGCYERVLAEVTSPDDWRGRRFAKYCVTVDERWRKGEVAFVVPKRILDRGRFVPYPPMCSIQGDMLIDVPRAASRRSHVR